MQNAPGAVSCMGGRECPCPAVGHLPLPAPLDQAAQHRGLRSSSTAGTAKLASPNHPNGGRQSQTVLKLGVPKPRGTAADLQKPSSFDGDWDVAFPQLPQQGNVRKPQPQPMSSQNLVNLSYGTYLEMCISLATGPQGKACCNEAAPPDGSSFVSQLEKALSRESWHFPGSSSSRCPASLPMAGAAPQRLKPRPSLRALPAWLSRSSPQPEPEELKPAPRSAAAKQKKEKKNTEEKTTTWF